MTKAKGKIENTDAAVELERPRRGGSYVRRDDGTLDLIEGPAPAESPSPINTDAPADGEEKSEG